MHNDDDSAMTYVILGIHLCHATVATIASDCLTHSPFTTSVWISTQTGRDKNTSINCLCPSRSYIDFNKS